MLSLLTIVAIITFAGFKMSALVNFDEYKVQLRLLSNYYNETEALGKANGFMIAASLTSYDGSADVNEDPTIGSLIFRWKRWNLLEPDQ